MDNFDFKILACLMKQARTSWAELGNMLGLSAPAAADRVHKMEEKGIIRGYAALVDPEALGYDIAALISITLARPEHRQMFLETIKEVPQILECHHVAGDEDYIVKVRSKGTRGIEQLISERIKAIPGVVKTRTTIILSTIKETPILPLDVKKE